MPRKHRFINKNHEERLHPDSPSGLYTPEEVKDMLKHPFLGYEVVERIDVTTQEPERVRTLKKTSQLDTGKMHIFMQKVEYWAIGIGCYVTIPTSSEYMKLKLQQNESAIKSKTSHGRVLVLSVDLACNRFLSRWLQWTHLRVILKPVT